MVMTLLTTNPDSTDVASVTFNSSIDNTYKLYIFKFINISPASDGGIFTFQVNATDGSGYNDSNISTTFFNAQHGEDDSTGFAYHTSSDTANAATFAPLTRNIGNGSDESANGTMWFFNPSGTTYVKHFYARFNNYYHADYSMDNFCAGYINDTTAIDDIQFKMDSGNMDGVIKMYGVG